MREKIYTLDTTLRDGLQGVGVALSLDERLRIGAALADLGIDYIEAGFLGSNPTTDQFLEKIQNAPWKKRVVVFGSTMKKGEHIDASPSLRRLVAHPFKRVSIVGKTWPLHLRHVLGVSRQENLALIEESIAYAKSHNKKVIYDAEHFFDAFKEDPDYALECLCAARDAEWITLCDTNGAHLAPMIYKATLAARAVSDKIGVHAHNDCEMAAANSLAAVRAGARLVQGTINGLGERCGNANLSSVIPNLEIKENYKAVGRKNLQKITAVSRLVDEISKQNNIEKNPFVGPLAFVHKGGMHGSAILKESRTFEHIDPGKVGNQSGITLSELAGRSNLESKLQEFNITGKDPGHMLAKLKDAEDAGYTYEQAEASLYLFLKEDPLPFEITSFEIKSDSKKSHARVTLKSGEREEGKKGKGKGPVEALDKSLRRSLKTLYPETAYMRLTDYRVHIVDSNKGTRATTRVFIDACDGESSWTTLGVSENIIEASLEALSDAYIYLINKK